MAKKKYPDNRTPVLSYLVPDDEQAIAALARDAQCSKSQYVANILAQVLDGELLGRTTEPPRISTVATHRFADSEIGWAQLATRISPSVTTHLARLHTTTGFSKRTLVEYAILATDVRALGPQREENSTRSGKLAPILSRVLPEYARAIAALARDAQCSKSQYVANILAQVLDGELLGRTTEPPRISTVATHRFADSEIGWAQLATRISPSVTTHLARLHTTTGFSKRTLVEYAILATDVRALHQDDRSAAPSPPTVTAA